MALAKRTQAGRQPQRKVKYTSKSDERCKFLKSCMECFALETCRVTRNCRGPMHRYCTLNKPIPQAKKNNFFAARSVSLAASTLMGRPRFLLAVDDVACFAVSCCGQQPGSSTTPFTASCIVCLERQRSMCSLNERSSAVCGRLQIGQCHDSDSETGAAGSLGMN